MTTPGDSKAINNEFLKTWDNTLVTRAILWRLERTFREGGKM